MTRRRVLFVCTGNICRSPTAAAVLAHLVRVEGLQETIDVGSAGTHDYCVGEAADATAIAAAARRGYDLRPHRARQVQVADFTRADLVLAMDTSNLHHLLALCPATHRDKVRMLLEFAPGAGRTDVPDPFRGPGSGFERVLDLVEAAVPLVLAHLRALG